MPYPDKQDQELIAAFRSLKSDKEMENFLRDILTISEIKEFSKRFQIAKLLWQGKQSYLEIAQSAQTSTTTVTRVAQWLFKEGLNGYQTVLVRLFPKLKKS